MPLIKTREMGTMTKRQHYVPQFYLENFVNKSGKLDVYDREKDSLIILPLKDACVQNYLYETRRDKSNIYFDEFILGNKNENELSIKEGQYANIIKRVIKKCGEPKNEKALICDFFEKDILADFMTNLFYRNPWTLKQLLYDEIPDYLREKPMIKGATEIFKMWEWGSIDPIIRAAEKRAFLNDEIQQSPYTLMKNSLKNIGFTILKAEASEFIISSLPVLPDFDKENMVQSLYCPLSKKYALLYVNNFSKKNIKNKITKASEEVVYELNEKYLKLNIDNARFLFGEKNELTRLKKLTS